MRFITFLSSVFVAACLMAQSGIDSPMTRAVLKVYADQLKADPTDWDTWMRRANEYYNHNQYARALEDVDNALKYIPGDNKAERFRAYMLRASIYQQTDRYADELMDLNAAIALDETSYVAIYQRANCNYELGNLTDAKSDYKRLMRLNARSVESLIGQARIAVKENNIGLANELLDQAVSFDPANSDYYVRRASVRRVMGNHQGAVEDLLLALSTDSSNSRATQALVDYGRENYPAVITGLTQAIEQAPNVGMFVYLRAMIAQAHYNYVAAISDYKRIIERNLYNYHGIYASMAECQLALCRYQEALDNVDHAISMDKNVASQYVLKSQVLRALGRAEEAVAVAAKATALAPGKSVPVAEMGLCYAASQNYKEAVNLFGEVSMNEPDRPESFMLRAWLLSGYLYQPVAAAGFYDHVAALDNFSDTDVRSLRGFALLFNGKTEEADAWMSNILEKSEDKDGFVNFMATCFYAAKGDTDRALACAEKSMKLGYANYYDWTANNAGLITTAPIRENPRFLELLAANSAIFGK
ncbi:MAG: tetratricopeptide repeat protein [Muribaculaceae bacterium]